MKSLIHCIMLIATPAKTEDITSDLKSYHLLGAIEHTQLKTF